MYILEFILELRTRGAKNTQCHIMQIYLFSLLCFCDNGSQIFLLLFKE